MMQHKALLPVKYTLIISAFAELMQIDFRQAFDLFYKSELYHEIRNGLSDMHCRSDGYLAEELRRAIDSAQAGQ